MKKILRLALVLLMFGATYSASRSDTAEAHPAPHFSGHFVNGVYLGWGHYPIIRGAWPFTRFNNHRAWNPFGYSYWGYWNYQPYYATFGAISYSPSTDRAGVAWGTRTQFEAMSRANGFCAVADCAPVVWVQGGCAAVAKSAESERLYWAHHTTRAWAESRAMLACNSEGTAGCAVGAWVCSW